MPFSHIAQSGGSPKSSPSLKGGQGDGISVDGQKLSTHIRVATTLIPATPEEATLLNHDGELIVAILEGPQSRRKQRDELLGPIRRGKTAALGEVEELPMDQAFLGKLRGGFRAPKIPLEDNLGKTRILTQQQLDHAHSIGMSGDEGEKDPNTTGANAKESLPQSRKPQSIYFAKNTGEGIKGLSPALLEYVGPYEHAGSKKYHQYSIGERIYLSPFPPNRGVKNPQGLTYTILTWQKSGDTFTKCSIVCFPLGQKAQLIEAGLLPHD